MTSSYRASSDQVPRLRLQGERNEGEEEVSWMDYGGVPTGEDLPTIILSNVLTEQQSAQQTYTRCWIFLALFYRKLVSAIKTPDTVFEIVGFTLPADGDNTSGKTKGGGLNLWSWVYTVQCQICDPDVEILGMMLRLFYLPGEFGWILLPPAAKASQAARTTADYVHDTPATQTEIFHQDSLDKMATVINDDINFCVQLVVPNQEVKI